MPLWSSNWDWDSLEFSDLNIEEGKNRREKEKKYIYDIEVV